MDEHHMECLNQPRLTISRETFRPAVLPSLLNLGCGQRFHPAWTNVDLAPADPSIRRCDVIQPLPFADATFDAVYHSHLLEHLPRAGALPFLRECRRVLKPGGIMRLAIPNLEAIARLYLYALEDAWNGDQEASAHHRWLLLELYDQATRETPGGAMLGELRDRACELAWYRLGSDGAMIRQQRESNMKTTTLRDRAKGWLLGSWRERLIRWLLGKEYPLIQVGRFRRAGEVHHWMYDRVSLRALLSEVGFTQFRCVGPMDSAVPGWNSYHLDATPDGTVCKPDSLFVEATREPDAPARNSA
jgi:predicted SAM-dependent methyltransferase